MIHSAVDVDVVRLAALLENALGVVTTVGDHANGIPAGHIIIEEDRT